MIARGQVLFGVSSSASYSTMSSAVMSRPSRSFSPSTSIAPGGAKNVDMMMLWRACLRSSAKPLLLPERDIGIWLIHVAALTPGSARRISTSRFCCASASSCGCRFTGRAVIVIMLASSARPDGRLEEACRRFTMYTALASMARLSATCTATSSGAVLLRMRTERMGRISMMASIAISTATPA